MVKWSNKVLGFIQMHIWKVGVTRITTKVLHAENTLGFT